MAGQLKVGFIFEHLPPQRLSPLVIFVEPDVAWALWLEPRTTTIGSTKWFEDRVHSTLLDFPDYRQELTESPLGITALFEPGQVFNRQIKDRKAVRRMFHPTVFPERHPGATNFLKKISEILPVDLVH